MAFLGLDWFELKKDKKLKEQAYSKLFFPFGDDQKKSIEKLLEEFIPNETKEVRMYNYIITKQKLLEKNISKLTNEETKYLVYYLTDNFITKNNNWHIYVAIAQSDVEVKEDLIYPSKEELQEKANLYKLAHEKSN